MSQETPTPNPPPPPGPPSYPNIPGVVFWSKGAQLVDDNTVEDVVYVIGGASLNKRSVPADFDGCETIITVDDSDDPVPPRPPPTPPPSGNNRKLWIRGGAQTGAVSWRAGTLGCWVTIQYGKKTIPCLLTASHVLRDFTKARSNPAPDPSVFYDECFQPSSSSTKDVIAHYHWDDGDDLDACFYVVDGLKVSANPTAPGARVMARGVEYVTQDFGDPVDPVKGMEVRKFGQKTGLTWGICSDPTPSGSFVIQPDNRPGFLPEDFPVALNGDSGSLWVYRDPKTERDHPVGLLTSGRFGGSHNYAVGVSANTIVRRMNILSFNEGAKQS